jgi:hypothetical protein
MGGLSFDVGVVALIVLALCHLLAGLGLGLWFRFGALLIAFAVVAVESVVGDFRFGIAPWWLLLIGGVALLQLGYGGAALVNPQRWAERRSEAQRSYRISAPK